VPLLVSLTRKRAIYLALELDRTWTEIAGVNPLGGTVFLDTASAFVKAFLLFYSGSRAGLAALMIRRSFSNASSLPRDSYSEQDSMLHPGPVHVLAGQMPLMSLYHFKIRCCRPVDTQPCTETV